jgi:DNA mismatch repair ATPase MutL
VATQDGAPKPPADAPSAKKPEAAPPRRQQEPPKSLDELLGVPSAPKSAPESPDGGVAPAASGDDAATSEQKQRLEKSLDEASVEDLVQRAVEGMKSASARLTDSKDPGIGTQRIQEDVVKTLDRLLAEAQKRQQKKSSGSKKQKQSKSDPSEQNGQQQKQQSRKQQQSKPSPSGSDSKESPNDQNRDNAVAATQELSESRIEWGQLPERVRELVLQGRRDRVSTIYERLTREYYRRLAEEASR